MSEESVRKKPRLSEDDLDNLPKTELIERLKKQETYISDLETKLESAPSTSGDAEEKTRQLKAARREQLLVMRLTSKEQELHELANQLTDKAQNASTAQLRSALVDPALNLLIQRLKKELEDKNTKLQQAHEDMAAWKFTPDSQTGKRLMARCRTLIQENQELGKQVSQGRIAQVESELALQKQLNDELKSSQDELYEMVIQLNDEGEGMQSTICVLQQQLGECQQELTRLKSNQSSSEETPDTVTATIKNEQAPNIDIQPDAASPEPMEVEEEVRENATVEVPTVRTTECKEEVMEEVSATMAEKDSLSVEPWTNQLHFVESPASPVHDQEDDRTSEEGKPLDTEMRTEEAPPAAEEGEGPPTPQGSSPKATEESSKASEESSKASEGSPEAAGEFPMATRESPVATRESPERTTASSSPWESREDLPVSREDEGGFDARQEPLHFRTPLDESSQDSALSGGVGDIETDDGSRTGGEQSDTLTPDLSTNGESNLATTNVTDAVTNNGETEQLYVNNEGEGVKVERSDNETNNEITNTFVQDPSTSETIEGESNSLDYDNGSDLNEKRTDDAPTDNDNGISGPVDCENSGVSSPLEDEVRSNPDGEVLRTDGIIKSINNTNSHKETPPEEGTETEQSDDMDCVLQKAVPPTNSNQEEIPV